MIDEDILDKDRDSTPSKKKSGVIDMNTVKVQLKCEVGVVSISMEELSNIKVGDMVEFGKWPNTVKLILNNSCIAEGYLVEVQGMLAVKIEQVY
jgi:flagellar motor switch/type III secretory pathway protein FliN